MRSGGSCGVNARPRGRASAAPQCRALGPGARAHLRYEVARAGEEADAREPVVPYLSRPVAPAATPSSSVFSRPSCRAAGSSAAGVVGEDVVSALCRLVELAEMP